MRAGDVLIWIGIAAIAVGVVVRLGWFSWFGHLPGDVRAEGERTGFFFPLTSSLVVSIAATVIINIVIRLFRDR